MCLVDFIFISLRCNILILLSPPFTTPRSSRPSLCDSMLPTAAAPSRGHRVPGSPPRRTLSRAACSRHNSRRSCRSEQDLAPPSPDDSASYTEPLEEEKCTPHRQPFCRSRDEQGEQGGRRSSVMGGGASPGELVAEDTVHALEVTTDAAFMRSVVPRAPRVQPCHGLCHGT